MIYKSIEEWKAEGKRRFGANMLKWQFKCPMCGHVAKVSDFKAAGATDPNSALSECLGRYMGKGSPKEGDSSGCNWAGYGFFGIPKEHDQIMEGSSVIADIFPFADVPTCEPVKSGEE